MKDSHGPARLYTWRVIPGALSVFEIPAVRVIVILYKSFIAAFTSSGPRVSAIRPDRKCDLFHANVIKSTVLSRFQIYIEFFLTFPTNTSWRL